MMTAQGLAAWRFPNADTKQFALGGSKAASGDDIQPVFIDGPVETPVFGEDGNARKGVYYSEKMLAALGLEPGFPLELQLNPASKPRLPPRSFDEDPRAPQANARHPNHLRDTNRQLPGQMPGRLIDVKITHATGVASRKWLAGPEMGHWPQQLNFALWCATTSCGISHRLLEKDDTDSSLDLPPMDEASCGSTSFSRCGEYSTSWAANNQS